MVPGHTFSCQASSGSCQEHPCLVYCPEMVPGQAFSCQAYSRSCQEHPCLIYCPEIIPGQAFSCQAYSGSRQAMSLLGLLLLSRDGLWAGFFLSGLLRILSGMCLLSLLSEDGSWAGFFFRLTQGLVRNVLAQFTVQRWFLGRFE